MRRHITEDTLLSIVAPLYNEVAILHDLVGEIRNELKAIGFPGRYEIVLVDDGSTDGSAEELDRIADRYRGQVKIVHLARNFGHSAATTAGLEHASGDVVILMDADMQDSPAAFGPFLEKWQEGYDVVYAVRVSRQEGLLRRLVFSSFYRILSWVADIELPRNAGNYSLMDRRVIDGLIAMPERNRYHPGLRAWAGFRQIGVDVPRRQRYEKGKRVGLRGQWKLAMNAVFSFSYAPLFFFRAVGVLSMGVSAFLIAFALYQKIRLGTAASTWFSLLVAISFFGGMNLFGIGVLGEYVARIYDQIRNRPAYILDRIAGITNARPASAARVAGLAPALGSGSHEPETETALSGEAVSSPPAVEDPEHALADAGPGESILVGAVQAIARCENVG